MHDVNRALSILHHGAFGYFELKKSWVEFSLPKRSSARAARALPQAVLYRRLLIKLVFDQLDGFVRHDDAGLVERILDRFA